MSELIYLASQSPRRSQLLDQLGVRHTPAAAQRGGDAPRMPDPSRQPCQARPRQLRRARDRPQARCRRAAPGAPGLPAAPILCADTTVTMGPRHGKPADAQDARHTGRAVGPHPPRAHRHCPAGGRAALAALSVSHVTFAELSPNRSPPMWTRASPLGKAGAYGIQGRAAALITHLSGSYSGHHGLALYETA